MAGKSALARQIAELERETPRDLDPEDDRSQYSSEGESDDGDEQSCGADKYVLGKSKLRERDGIELGPEYVGRIINRKDLDESEDEDSELEYGSESDDSEEFADPDTFEINGDSNNEHGDIDSDEAFGESDTDKFKDFTFRGSSKPRIANGRSKRKSAADFYSDSEDSNEKMSDANMNDNGALIATDSDLEKSEISSEKSDDESDESDSADEDMEQDFDSENEDSGEEEENARRDVDEANRAEFRKIMNEDQKSVVGTITQAAKSDAVKGVAIKTQRKTFDTLLNVRIRLQKALVATNSMVASEDEEKELETSQPYKAAEEAAMKLLDTLNDMRQTLDNAADARTKASKKRKHSSITRDTPSSVIWQHLQDFEAISRPVRDSALSKWSSKVQSATVTRNKLNNTQNSITDVIHDQLSHSDRLIKRTQIPRSCAPEQLKAKIAEDPAIYDDADFYQLLLKELIDQRMETAPSGGPLTSGNHAGMSLDRSMAQLAAVREAKTKKTVDTKASKGRKMRYTVHEKLQGFMEPENRGSWEKEEVDRFFASLLGQRANLDEEEIAGDDSDGEAALPDEAEMLFASGSR